MPHQDLLPCSSSSNKQHCVSATLTPKLFLLLAPSCASKYVLQLQWEYLEAEDKQSQASINNCGPSLALFPVPEVWSRIGNLNKYNYVILWCIQKYN